jgi:diguanylate cyclase (GGDEF)-like protein
MLISSSRREQIQLVCAMIDIDLFKQVNDTHGHDVGDLVICQVADLIRERMRATDIVARIGGEEFCVLAVNMGAHAAELVFEGLRREIADSAISYSKDKSLHVSVSIGVCTETMESLEEMLKKADTLLYTAKDSGRNCVKLN